MSQQPDHEQHNKNNNAEDEWLAEEEQMEARLRAALHRQDCPDTMTLGYYQLGLLATAEMEPLRAHLERCPYCQAEVEGLTDFLADEEPLVDPKLTPGEQIAWTPAAGLEWQQLKAGGQVAIRLLADTLNEALANLKQQLQPPSSQPALGGLRGQKDQRLLELPLRDAVEDFEAIITIDTGWHDPDHCTVIVDVNILSLGGWPNLRGTEVTMKQGEQAIMSRTTNAFGQAVFEGVPTADLLQHTFEITPRGRQ